jgi:DNA-binding NarL/FixJ family response regulator
MAGAQEKSERAARLWGAAEDLREKIKAPLPADDGAILKPYLDAARARLNERAWEEPLVQGRAMGLEEAIEYALSEEAEHEPQMLVAVPEQQLPPADERTEGLTAREKEVAIQVSRGLTNRQIASELFISEHTAATHVRRILKKLGLKSRAQVGSWVTEHGLPRSGPS